MSQGTTNLSEWLRAVWPDQFFCLRRRLVPLRVGHIMLLLRLESPFVTGARVPDAADLALAILICTRSVREATRLVTFGSWWSKLAMNWTGIRCAFGTQRGISQFSAYLLSGIKGPRWWSKSTKGAPMRTPFWLAVLTTLQRDLLYRPEEARELAAARALWECSAVWEGNDAIDLVSNDEWLAMERALADAQPPNGHAMATPQR